MTSESTSLVVIIRFKGCKLFSLPIEMQMSFCLAEENTWSSVFKMGGEAGKGLTGPQGLTNYQQVTVPGKRSLLTRTRDYLFSTQCSRQSQLQSTQDVLNQSDPSASYFCWTSLQCAADSFYRVSRSHPRVGIRTPRDPRKADVARYQMARVLLSDVGHTWRLTSYHMCWRRAVSSPLHPTILIRTRSSHIVDHR